MMGDEQQRGRKGKREGGKQVKSKKEGAKQMNGGTPAPHVHTHMAIRNVLDKIGHQKGSD